MQGKIKDNIPNEIKQICDNFESYKNKCRAELDKYDKALKPLIKGINFETYLRIKQEN